MAETPGKEQDADAKLNTSLKGTVSLPQFELKEKGGELRVKRTAHKGVNQASDYWLPYEDAQRLINAPTDVRDRAILACLYFGMLRRHEARSLKIEDIDFENRVLHLKITKGTKDGKKENPRSVPIVEDRVFDYLRLHIRGRKAGWVFLSKSKDGRLSNAAINEIVGRAAQLAGIANPNPKHRRLNPHILRHSFARYLRRRQPPIAIEVLQKLLGHKSVSTTMNIYATADLDFMQSELKRCARKEE